MPIFVCSAATGRLTPVQKTGIATVSPTYIMR